MEPLISIIVPVYKVEQYLRECIDSIINQTYKNLEIILVDDGSPDNCGIICDEYSAKDPRIKVIHKENGGLSDARNCALNIASGEYFSFVDSDDWISTEMIQDMFNPLSIHTDAKISCCGRYDVYPDKTKTGLCPPSSGIIPSDVFLKRLFKKQTCDVAVWDKLFHRSLFDGIRFPVGEINEDASVIFEIIKKTSYIATVGKPLYYYRHRPGSITQSIFSERNLIVLKNSKKMLQLCETDYPHIARFALFYYTERLLETCIKVHNSANPDPKLYSGLMAELSSLKKNLRLSYKIKYIILRTGMYSKVKRIYTTVRRALCTK